ncbi:hypothetical protein AD10_5072 [Escherichia coli 1-182-04_S4_C2]|nr:hypothetical protein AD10_5072 [Escherichia coli 1-182-04_S4_C2]
MSGNIGANPTNTDSVLKSPDMMPSGCIQRAGCCLLMLICQRHDV